MLAAVAAVLSGVSAATPAGPATLTVVRARSQLAGGVVLAAEDLRADQVVAADAPSGAATEAGQLIGRTLAGPVAKGAVLTELALTSPRAATSSGRVVAPLRLADADLASLLKPGDTVDVIAADAQTGRAAVVATGVRVVTVPHVDDQLRDGSSTGALVLVEADRTTATTMARAAAGGTMSVIWR